MASSSPDLGKPQFASHTWVEPIIVLAIMIGSLVVNRRRNYAILPRRSPVSAASASSSSTLPLDDDDDDRSSPDFWLLANHSPASSRSSSSTLVGSSDDDDDDDDAAAAASSAIPVCCGLTVTRRSSARWAHHLHSRILQKFPFLVEMFYWAVNYLFYSFTKATAQWLCPSDVAVAEVAQQHAIDILNFEHRSAARFFFPIHESDFQAYFIHHHRAILTFFNRIYSLVHIPGTVLFLSWYYYAAPDHPTFAVVRRTMSLGNLAAFTVFCFYPCMPPRLLPESFRFYDTVRQDNAESIWVQGKSINQLAAMPSLHFTYAFTVGCTLVYHSGFLHRLRLRRRRARPRRSLPVELFYLTLGVTYPLLVLSVIVATANHYWLDAVAAVVAVGLCFWGNRVLLLFLPLEYALCWALRLAKPVPTTGDRGRRRRRRHPRRPHGRRAGKRASVHVAEVEVGPV